MTRMIWQAIPAGSLISVLFNVLYIVFLLLLPEAALGPSRCFFTETHKEALMP